MSKILSIHTYGDPVLRTPSQPVAAITPEIKQLVEDMFTTTRRPAGLAAQQVGRTEGLRGQIRKATMSKKKTAPVSIPTRPENGLHQSAHHIRFSRNLQHGRRLPELP